MSTTEKQIKSNIKTYGVHIIHVMEEGDEPNFSYTIGLYENYQQPEIIIIGLQQDLNQVILNNIAYDNKEERVFVSGKKETDILNDYECLFVEVDKKNYSEYLGIAIDYYKGKDFAVMQLIWPTPEHLFPYDKNAPEGFKKWQPVLGTIKTK